MLFVFIPVFNNNHCKPIFPIDFVSNAFFSVVNREKILIQYFFFFKDH